jgi:hypothetical protein
MLHLRRHNIIFKSGITRANAMLLTCLGYTDGLVACPNDLAAFDVEADTLVPERKCTEMDSTVYALAERRTCVLWAAAIAPIRR